MKLKTYDKKNCIEIYVSAFEDDDSSYSQTCYIEDKLENRKHVDFLLVQTSAIKVMLEKAELLKQFGFTFDFIFEKDESVSWMKGWKCKSFGGTYYDIDYWTIEIYYYTEEGYRIEVEADA